MKIGNININGIAALAPMAGTADKAFREICVSFGAAYVVSEMVSAKALNFSDKKSRKLMNLSEHEQPCGIQIFGSEPNVMASAAEIALGYNPQIIDINMGCPAPKVTSNGCGSALMKSPKLCFDIVSAVKRVSDVPVTVKIRKGFDENSVNALEIAKICEQAGADAITVHGRTRNQMYSGKVDLDIIKKVKDAVNIPVIGNGDIKNAHDAFYMIEKTGCDMVMIGRGALGNPFIFQEINIYNKTEKLIPKPSVSQKLTVLLKHINLICKYKGEYIGMKEARKHVAWYIKGLKDAASFRNEAGSLKSLSELNQLVCKVYKAQYE